MSDKVLDREFASATDYTLKDEDVETARSLIGVRIPASMMRSRSNRGSGAPTNLSSADILSTRRHRRETIDYWTAARCAIGFSTR